MNNQYRILVCDINIRPQGHYIGFNQYILENFEIIEQSCSGIRVSFLFNRAAEKLLSFNEETSKRVSFIDFEGENTMLNRYRMIRKIQKFTDTGLVDHLLFMDLDQYQIPFYFTRFRSQISGILFRPHHRIETSNDSKSEIFKTDIRRFKKKLAEKLFIKKSSIRNIFVLNDQEGVLDLNRIHHSSIFKYLPDPVFSYRPDNKFNGTHEKDPEIYRYLIFGSISERKNITNIIRAYDRTKFLYKTELLIIGPCSDEYYKKLCDNINALESMDGIYKTIFFKRGFVSNEEMDYYFSVSNVCLIIYKDFFGSSGIMGRASLHKMKIIGPNTGLLNELINTHKIGLSADPDDISKISRSLIDIRDFKIDSCEQEKFYKQRSPEKFISALAKSVTP
jgi:glycosyltransferase involved in cell wall biosynthesis